MGLTLAEKILKAHTVDGAFVKGGEIGLKIDQTLTQDATGTMAYIEFEAMGIGQVRTERSVAYIDHNTLQSGFENADDHRFIASVAKKHGIYFSRPGNGICHQVHLERFGAPGKTLIGSDSHTPTGGGIGMIAIGAGGLDVAVAMGGGAYYITYPKIVRVTLTGKLSPWVAAKDVILKLLSVMSVKGGVGKIIEYAGEGVSTLSVPERATIKCDDFLNYVKKEENKDNDKEENNKNEEKEGNKEGNIKDKLRGTNISINNLYINVITPSASDSEKLKSPSSSNSYSEASYKSSLSIDSDDLLVNDVYFENNKRKFNPYSDEIINKNFLRKFNSELKNKIFVNGESYSHLDYYLYYKLKSYFKKNKKEKKNYPHLVMWIKYLKKFKKMNDLKNQYKKISEIVSDKYLTLKKKEPPVVQPPPSSPPVSPAYSTPESLKVESEEEEYYPMSTGTLPPPVVPASILEKIPPKKDRMLCKKTPEKPENPPEKKSKKNKGKRKEKKLGSESGMKVLYKQMTSKYKQGPLVDPNNNKKKTETYILSAKNYRGK